MLKNIPLKQAIVPHRNATMKDVSGLDPYNKGAYVLHMLRFLIGEISLLEILKEFVNMKKDLPHNQVSTQDFIDLVHSKTGTNLDWFFKVYLYEKDYPVLIKKTEHGSNHTFIELYWENEGFYMPVEVAYSSITGLKNRRVSLSNKPTKIAIPQYNNIRIDPKNWLLYTLSE